MGVGLASMKNVVRPLSKSVLIPQGLTAAASVTNTAVQKRIHGSGMNTLITSSKEMEDLMKIVKSIEESSLVIKGICEGSESKAKEQKDRFLGPILGAVAAALFGNLLAAKGVIQACEGTIRGGQDF